jgi:(S)-sulfolactate dehydrogenase
MAAMALLRPAFGLTARVIAGGWPREAAIGRELAGRRAGLVGFGGTARATAARLRALGMKVAASDPALAADHPAWAHAERLALDDLLASADLISLHVPLTKGTKHLIGAAELARMKPSAILVNAARGGVVDEAALIAALKSDRLAGAALDVFEREPLDAEAEAAFHGVPNLILTPHIAGVTLESNIRVSALIADIIIRELEYREPG